MKDKKQNEILTMENVKNFLEYIVQMAKNKMNSTRFFPASYKKISTTISKLCDKFNIAYIPIDFCVNNIEHNFSIMGFETEYGKIYFLVDLSHIQPNNKINVIKPENKKSFTTEYNPWKFISDENKEQLIKSGYLVLTVQNFEDYIGSIIESYKLIKSIDERRLYDEIYALLEYYNISFADKDYIKNEGRNY